MPFILAGCANVPVPPENPELIDALPEVLYQELQDILSDTEKQAFWEDNYEGKRVRWWGDLISLDIVEDENKVIAIFYSPHKHALCWYSVAVLLDQSYLEDLSQVERDNLVLSEGTLICYDGWTDWNETCEKYGLSDQAREYLRPANFSLIDGVVIRIYLITLSAFRSQDWRRIGTKIR